MKTITAIAAALVCAADIGQPPSEGHADFSDLLLEANLQSDTFFAKKLRNRPLCRRAPHRTRRAGLGD